MERTLAQNPSLAEASVPGTYPSDAIATLYRLARPWIFRLDPEQAHRATLLLLHLAGRTLPGQLAMRALFPPRLASRRVHAFGLDFANPVGLAAGYDKDGLAWRGLASLGFGSIEIGTVTPRPQSGNPQPRIFRLVEDEAIINRMGFPNEGAGAVAARLRGRRPDGLVLGVNIGKNQSTPLEAAAEDYLSLLRTFAPLADYLAVNVSSPNTQGLRSLQTYPALSGLLAAMAREREGLRAGLGKPLPILVKLAPDLSSADLDGALRAVEETGMDGVILTNTSLRRERTSSALRREAGGLSGTPLEQTTLKFVQTVCQRTDGRVPVVASGGVMTPDSAQRMLDAGAVLVQVYTGLIYQGPSLVRQMVGALR